MTIVLRRDESAFFVKFERPSNDRFAVKECGFRFDRDNARWITRDPKVVAELVSLPGVEVTQEAAEAVRQARTEAAEAAIRASVSVIASAATDADIDIPAPEGLSYLPYQRAGIAYALSRKGVLIADEMGLGKTIQAIGIANADASVRRVLVICPASLKLNWRSEFKKWSVRGLSVGIATSKGLPDTEVVILNFEIVSKLRPAIDSIAWDLLIVDEAHYLKNPKAQRTVAVFGGSKARVQPIRAGRRVFLTGTPIVNRPCEIWPLVKSLDPEGLGAMGWFGFARRYCDGYDTAFGFEAKGATNLDELQTKLRASIMVRRLKKDVLTELPAKRRQLLPFEPNAEIKRLVKAMEKAHAENERRIAALRKQAAQVENGSNAYNTIAEQIRKAAQVAFEEMSRHRHDLAVAKAPIVVEHVREILETEDSVVVACHHLDVVDVLVEGLQEFGVNLITGRESHEKRQAAKEAFMAGKGRVVIGTIGAMAEGWTLTRASKMVFAELDWTPGKVSQTEDRIHRIGQQNSVLIQHLVVEESMDVTFVEKLIAKQKVIEAALDEGDRQRMSEDVLDLYGTDDFSIEATTTEAEAEADFVRLVEEREEEVRKQAAEREERARKAAEDWARRAEESAKTREERDRERVVERMSDREERAEAAGRDGAMKLLESATDDMISASYEALRIVCSYDGDYAREDNGIGFSQADTMIGHRLAEMPASYRTDMMNAYALLLARRYRGQVDVALVERIMPTSGENDEVGDRE